MWQRRVLQAELGPCDALVQLSLDALKRFSAGQSTGSSPALSFAFSDGDGGTPAYLLPYGAEWSLRSNIRNVTVASLSLVGLDADGAGNARARWAVTLTGSDETRVSFGRILVGGIRASSPLGELVQRYEGLYGRLGPGLIANPVGKPVAIASQQSVTAWSASAELLTPLTASVRAANGVVSVSASLTGAALSVAVSPAFGATAASALQSQLASRLDTLFAGRVPALCPEISALGEIGAHESAPEALPLTCKLRVVGSPASALGVFLTSNAGAMPPQPGSDLTAGADCAFLIRESAIQKTLAFCFRTDRFPKHWRSEIVQQETSQGNVNVLTSLDVESASISLAAFAANSARQEDRADLVIVARASIVDVKNPDGSSAPQEARDQLTVNATFTYTLDLYFSNVGTPAPAADPQLNVWFQQWRSQVSRRFSVPFAGVAGATLLERAINGPEKVMLSRQTLAF
jgi:hypothetical protein